jgi:hypothetical protein
LATGKRTSAAFPTGFNNSNVWVEYDGISNHKKILNSNSNFEEFDVKVMSSRASPLGIPNTEPEACCNGSILLP